MLSFKAQSPTCTSCNNYVFLRIIVVIFCGLVIGAAATTHVKQHPTLAFIKKLEENVILERMDHVEKNIEAIRSDLNELKKK